MDFVQQKPRSQLLRDEKGRRRLRPRRGAKSTMTNQSGLPQCRSDICEERSPILRHHLIFSVAKGLENTSSGRALLVLYKEMSKWVDSYAANAYAKKEWASVKARRYVLRLVYLAKL
jgi:hypothetical protein